MSDSFPVAATGRAACSAQAIAATLVGGPSPSTAPAPESAADTSTPEPERPQWTRAERYVSWVPMCGGWCVPTASPEQTCLRHFSNENSMVKPFEKQWMVRRMLEHSHPVRVLGGIGCALANRHRAAIMGLAAFCSVAGWLCMFGASFGVSRQGAVVRRMAWAVLEWHSDEAGLDAVWVRAYFGIRTRVFESHGVAWNGTALVLAPGYEVISVERWGSQGACGGTIGFDGSVESEEALAFCTSCEESSLDTISFIWMSVATQAFQITSDLQRLTPYGDMNCQKLLGWTTSVLGLCTGLSAIFSFLGGCWRHFPPSLTFDEGYGDLPVRAVATRSIGRGCALMMLAVFLKIVDAACHLAVQVPGVKRRPVARPLSLASYCALCSEPTRWSQPLRPRSKWMPDVLEPQFPQQPPTATDHV